MPSDNIVSQPSGKPFNVLGAISDLVILVLLLGGAGFGGYFVGTQQRLAPVAAVPPGTPGPLPAESAATLITPALPPASTPVASATTKSTSTAGKATSNQTKASKVKYWLSSSGEDYTGYSVTVSVNGTAVDNFFGPGKNVDVTRYVVAGDNTVLFEAKALGDQYNKHKGDASSILTVQLVSGPQITEDFKPADVVLGYQRNAAETQDFKDTQHFAKE